LGVLWIKNEKELGKVYVSIIRLVLTGKRLTGKGFEGFIQVTGKTGRLSVKACMNG
jgi:hypothetical protein